MSTLKVGLVGVGGISRTHMPGWAASEEAEVVAGSDISSEALEQWGVLNNVRRLTTNADELFSDPDIDIIDLCVPNMYHAPLAIAALEAGKHVICEKPLAPTPQDIEKMIAARDKSGKLLMTAQHFRFAGVSQAMKAEIDTGTLGDVYHARGWMLRRNGMIPTATFIEKRHSGGGPCIDIGVHILDLTLWLMGNPRPVTVSGVADARLAHHPGAFATWQEGPDSQQLSTSRTTPSPSCALKPAPRSCWRSAGCCHHDIRGEDMQAWLYGDEGGCHWPSAQFLDTNYTTRQFNNRTLQLTQDKMEPHALECVEFAKAIAAGAPSPVPAEHSLQVLAILDGIYRSQAEGREVSIEL